MSSRKSVVISFVTVGIVALLGFVVLATWFFFLRYTFFSNVNAQFRANKVCGEVSANAIFAGQIYNMTVDGQNDSSKRLIYSGDQEDKREKLVVPNNKVFDLSLEYDYVVLEYLFKNTSSDEEWLVDLSLEMVKAVNVDVTVMYSETGITDYTLIQDTYTNDYISRLPVSTNGVMFVYIKIQIFNSQKDAEFATKMQWTLNSRSYFNAHI